MNNEKPIQFLGFDQNKVDDILGKPGTVIPTKIKKEATFVVLLKFVNSISMIYDQEDNIDGEFEDISEAFSEDTDSNISKSLSLRSYIIIKGVETLKRNIQFLIRSCKFLDLENSFIISDNKNITESLEIGNNLIKYITSKFQDGHRVINNYLNKQEEYLKSSGVEFVTFNKEFEDLLNIAQNMTPPQEEITNNTIPDDILEEYNDEVHEQQSE